jgi:hypothetical protein
MGPLIGIAVVIRQPMIHLGEHVGPESMRLAARAVSYLQTSQPAGQGKAGQAIAFITQGNIARQ